VEGCYPDADLLIWQAHLFALTPCRRKKGRGFGNFVPEFFIDPEARSGKISRLVHNFI
jgi:hypothetical protein